MFLEFYGLREQPFGVTPDPRFLYLSPMHREALASLYYGVEAGRGFLSMIARPGMGKTTLLFQLLEEFRNAAKTAFLFQTQCDSREFIRFLLAELGIESKEQDRVKMHEDFNAVLLKEMKAGKRFVVVIDEAQNLDDSVLETVRLLSNFETPRTKLMQIILSGQPELADKLARPNLSQLRQRVSIVSRLEPLPPPYIQEYISHRLKVAGHGGDELFLPDAIAAIVEKSEGIPRTINNLCFNAMSLGYAIGQRQIDASLVEEISGDLNLETVMSRPRAPQFTIPFNSPIFGPTTKWGQFDPPAKETTAVATRSQTILEKKDDKPERTSIDNDISKLVEELNAIEKAEHTKGRAEEPSATAHEVIKPPAAIGEKSVPVTTPRASVSSSPASVPGARPVNYLQPSLQVVARRQPRKQSKARKYATPIIFTVLAIDVMLGAIFFLHQQNVKPDSTARPAAAMLGSLPSPEDHALVSDEAANITTPSQTRVTVPEDVMKQNLVHAVNPEAPVNARGDEGTVLLEATVGRDGTVRSARVLDGDPALGKAATNAVMQWRYKPYLVDGQATDVDTQIKVNFNGSDERSSR